MTLTDPSAPAKRSRPRGAKVLMILGGILLVVGVVGAQWGINRVQDTADDISNSGDDVRNGLLTQVPVPGEGQVDLDPGRYDIFVLAARGTGFSRTTTTSPVVTDATATTDPDRTEVDEPVVSVTGPDGRPVVTQEPGVESLFSGAAGELYAIESFTATKAGTYRISATGTGAAKVGVGPTVDTGNVGRIVSGGLFTLLAFLGGGIGAILGLAGLIWFLVAGDGSPKRGPAGLYPPGPRVGQPGAPPGWSAPSPGPWSGPTPGGWAPPGQWAPPGGSAWRQPGPPGWPPAPARPPDADAEPGTRPPPPDGSVAGGSTPPPTGPPGPAPPAPRPAPWGDAPPEADGPSR